MRAKAGIETVKTGRSPAMTIAGEPFAGRELLRAPTC